MTKRPARRVIALSTRDQERLNRGDISTPEEALRQGATPSGAPHGGPDATEPPDSSGGSTKRTKQSDDERILREVPPHFGRL